VRDEFDCERAEPLCSDGLSLADLEALSAEGAIIKLTETNKMDMLMKMLMGGWIPEGKRTQWLAFGVFAVAVINSGLAWGTGGEGMMDVLKEMQMQWETFAIAFGLYFVGEKVDTVK
jgi:hypothetical protein